MDELAVRDDSSTTKMVQSPYVNFSTLPTELQQAIVDRMTPASRVQFAATKKENFLMACGAFCACLRRKLSQEDMNALLGMLVIKKIVERRERPDAVGGT